MGCGYGCRYIYKSSRRQINQGKQMKIEDAIDIALHNIAKHGDTDVFPFPFETHLFFDNHAECKKILLDIHANFDNYMAQSPPSTLDTLTQVGYTGFRWATQIEPFWNAYYLALVVSIAEEIESSRVPIEKESVFSYRYEWDQNTAKIFKPSTWGDYKKKSLEISHDYQYVVVTDIADFYPRIYHHRIDNALRRLPKAGETPKKIMDLLFSFSKNVSYGLPVGGPASRILAELALVTTDLQLSRRNIKFCRYADDYSIFCNSKSDAYKVLVLLSEKLHNEGLSLQKKKTKIITTEEFRETSRMLDPADKTNPLAEEEQKLLNISLRYDPYSDTADEDYEALKAAINNVDIIGILGREVSKTTIDATVTKQAINAIYALEPHEKYGAISTLLQTENLSVLSPVFVLVMRAVKGVYDDIPDYGQEYIDRQLVSLYESESELLSVDLNISYYVLALSKRRSLAKEEILIDIFDNTTKPLIKRQVIMVMASWGCYYWLTDVKGHYSGFTEWEKRALIIASYALGDEGKHWRTHTKDTWRPQEILIRDWYSSRSQKNMKFPI
ncbi:RNA-directed DNA polymerase (Reverse transcriptase) [Allochromatium vinosum DSM 180]|uniref:RNA-directed DNA polymerase (Reverse transcriptase) n=2 Tax=Allochromatium vinosum TaxID=1049 RepID=D3RS57_ALLVD|nr:RNA-directed DNA polymerase (Reverse transcriptase) [Allochromatium vinosum DSM 180]